ncbi:hypothetical protein [Paenibacillus sp. lzh-N1]|uniref:hypothetical protein n=1 Tax=Paenibacillus sp. lzh-N1 TaxID=2069255 RepID=UPI000AF3D0D3|nr:hypothetical protein [Paenibacillus sp. lzh-N1]
MSRGARCETLHDPFDLSIAVAYEFFRLYKTYMVKIQGQRRTLALLQIQMDRYAKTC